MSNSAPLRPFAVERHRLRAVVFFHDPLHGRCWRPRRRSPAVLACGGHRAHRPRVQRSASGRPLLRGVSPWCRSPIPAVAPIARMAFILFSLSAVATPARAPATFMSMAISPLKRPSRSSTFTRVILSSRGSLDDRTAPLLTSRCIFVRLTRYATAASLIERYFLEPIFHVASSSSVHCIPSVRYTQCARCIRYVRIADFRCQACRVPSIARIRSFNGGCV